MNLDSLQINLKNMLKKDPDNEEYLCQLAYILIEKGDLQNALKILKRAVIKKPSLQTYNNLGYFYLREGEPYKDRWFYKVDKAIQVLNKSLEINDNHYFPYALIGEAYLKKGFFKLAEIFLKKADDLKETYVIKNNIGIALYKQKKVNQAEKYFNEAYDLNEGNFDRFDSYLSYGISQAQLGKKYESEKIADYLIIQRNDFVINIVDIMLIYLINKNYRKVLELISIALDEYVIDSNLFSIYILSLYKTNQQKKAEEFLQEVINDSLENIKELQFENDFDEEDKLFYINKLKSDIKIFKKIFMRIKKNGESNIEYNPAIKEDCYFYGCMRHNNSFFI